MIPGGGAIMGGSFWHTRGIHKCTSGGESIAGGMVTAPDQLETID
jgi:hypothetical protein